MNIFFLLSVFVFSAFSATAQTAEQTKSSNEEESTEEESFVPSLSQTISDTHKRKSQIKRQLAREWSDTSKRESHFKKNPPLSPAQTAHFGDFEIDISERKQEEELRDNKKGQ